MTPYERETQRILEQLRRAAYDDPPLLAPLFAALPPPSVESTPPTERHTHIMLEVGKIVTERANLPSSFGRQWDYEDHHVDTSWITVNMSDNEKGVCVKMVNNKESVVQQFLTATQAVELGQLLMKTAETQAEYVKATTELNAQRQKLDETIKDRITGFGLKTGSADQLRVIEA